MQIPKMILFDYGQTLCDEEGFDGLRGTEAVLKSCFESSQNITAQEIRDFANELNKELGKNSNLYQFELHNHSFQNYLYEFFGLKRIVSQQELEKTFWDAAAPAKPTKNIIKFLDYLHDKNIRTGVISNISFSGNTLAKRLNELLPNNRFEFIMATSEYIFRKPHKRIFELALLKSNLSANEVWYCGDNAYCDVDGAKGAGIMPIWYEGACDKFSQKPHEECMIIHDWVELMELMNKV